MIDDANAIWDQASANFGEALVRHIVQLHGEERPSSVDQSRWDVIRSLAAPNFLATVAPERQASLRRALLLGIHGEMNQTYLEVCRASLGGGMPACLGQPVVDSFTRLVFNGLALECMPGSEFDRFSITAAFQEPLLSNPAAVALLQDSDLSLLFPEADATPDGQGAVSATSLLTWLPAGGGTTDLGIVIGSFVEQTLARMRFMGELNEESIVGFVQESLDQLRKFARGEEVSVLHLTGLVGIEVVKPLDQGTWGIRSSAGLAIHQPHPSAELQPLSVLWTKTPQRLLSATRSDIDRTEVDAIFAEMQDHASLSLIELNRRIMVLRYGLLSWAVESGIEAPINILATSAWSLLPISQSIPPFLEMQGLRMHSTTTLEFGDLELVAEIVEGIGEATPRLDIALSRIVRVASERRDPVDALIDAVIAWENMLGSKSETTMKVCAAMGWLLEPDHEGKRSAMFSKAKKIYALRSDLVHGSVEADPNLASEYGQDALKMAVKIFRLIHADPTLRDIKSSSRSEQILMRSRP